MEKNKQTVLCTGQEGSIQETGNPTQEREVGIPRTILL